MQRLLQLLWEQPARLVIASFLSVAVVGALFLSLPAATVNGAGLGPLEALFTATSAVCVTGLIVVDTATYLSPFGQAVVLVLIQIGGLGIMAFTMATVYLVRRRLTMDEAELLSFMLSENNRARVVAQLGRVLLITLTVEAVGAALLILAARGTGVTWSRAAWEGIFHAVSAFNNAGFALHSDSLESYASSGVVNTVVMLLILIGGVGFGTLALLSRTPGESSVDVTGEEMMYRPQVLQTRRRAPLRRFVEPASLSAQVVLAGTAVLVLSGALLFYLLEARYSLLGMSLPNKYLASLFQSVTLRTAGFNTVPIADLRRPTLLVMLPFMFIGAASGGTAGGIKIGTMAAIVAEVRRFFLQERDARLFARRLPGRLVTQATVLLSAGIFVVFLATIVLSITESAPLELVLFEAVSALGTVGLSAGLTPDLSPVGRGVVIALMFIGRLGPLTLFAAFRPEGRAAAIRLPEGEIPIG